MSEIAFIIKYDMIVQCSFLLFLDYAETPFEVPADSNWFVFLLKWPITFVLWLSVPDCRKHSKLTMLSFSLCIIWIGLISYVVAILITIIGMEILLAI